MLEIIGPGRITYEHKKEILFQTSELEKEALKVDQEVQDVCSAASRFARDMRGRLEKFITLHNLEDEVYVIPERQMFSQYSDHSREEFIVPRYRRHKGGLSPLNLTDYQYMFLQDLNEKYAIGRMTFDITAEKFRERQRKAYNNILQKTMVEEFFEQQTMGFGHVILYLENRDREKLDRHELDLTCELQPQLEIMPHDSRFKKPFSPTERNIRKLEREAEKEGAAIYLVSNFSDIIKPHILLDYTAQMLQHRYVQPHRRLMREHPDLDGPSLFALQSETGEYYGVKIGEFEIPEEIADMFMQESTGLSFTPETLLFPQAYADEDDRT